MGCLKLTYRPKNTLQVVKSERSREQKVEWMWMNVDPLAEEFSSWSPYNYVFNNPLKFTDPTGMAPEIVESPATDIWKLFKKEDGTYRAEKQHINDGKSDQIYLVMGEDGAATSMYQGVEAENNMSKDGISISDRDNGNTTMGVIKDATVDFWTSDEYRTRNARETMVNYVTSVVPAEGMVVGMLAQTAKLAQGSKWVYGGFKTSTKWANQLAKRGWTEKQITQAISKGKSFDAVNNVNKANKATRYVHPNSGQSVVIDNVTNELLHVGGKGFKY